MTEEKRTIYFGGETIEPTESQQVLAALTTQYNLAVRRDGWRVSSNQRVTEATTTFKEGIIDGLTSGVIQPADLATVFADTIRSEEMYKDFALSGRDDDY